MTNKKNKKINKVNTLWNVRLDGICYDVLQVFGNKKPHGYHFRVNISGTRCIGFASPLDTETVMDAVEWYKSRKDGPND